jgi:glucose-6-phosphate isomerase
VWGASGNDAQHSFFQLLHQGSLRSAVDFVLVRQSPIADAAGQLLANANALAQIEGLAMGFDSGDAQRYHPGSRPASVLIGDRLSAHMLGALIAAYEHKVFIQSLIWGVNPFDQYGVEYGKLVCRDTYLALSSGDVSSLRTIRKLVSKVS